MTIARRETTMLVGALQELRSRLDGALLTAGDPLYDEARSVQDISIDARPLALVRAANAGDVAQAVRLAAEHDLPLAVRSGGHSLAAHSMIDDSLVVDLSGMKAISIDPESRVARAQAGVISRELGAQAAEHGLSLTTGDTATVGLGGQVTGGGIGFMVRKYGLTIDHLLAAEVVTAAGEIVTASPASHPDLFWAIRGGGGNFGIITEFSFRLVPVAQILGGDLLLPATRETVRGYLEYAAAAPDELSTIGNLMYAPPAPFVPEEWVGKLVLDIIVCWCGSMEAGEQAVAPLRTLAEPVADTLRPMPYLDIFLSTAHQELRHGASLRSMFADELSDETLDALLDGMQHAPSPYSIVHLRGLGGQLARVPADATAFAHRDKRYLVSIIGVWLDEAEDPESYQNWTLPLWEQIRHDGEGVYVNFLQREGPERLHDAYPLETLARLAGIKRRYDPHNLFRFNQNIPTDP